LLGLNLATQTDNELGAKAGALIHDVEEILEQAAGSSADGLNSTPA